MVGIERVFVVSLIAGSVTGFGSLPIFIIDKISHRTYDSMIALAAGILTGTSLFALILPGLGLGGMVKVIPGIIAGGFVLLFLDRMIPIVHNRFHGEHLTDLKKRTILIGGSITLQNFPEGLAIG
ncbi:MAG: ZIP family metal transporter, partial [Candidatus Hadarchaeia archaeon]